MAFDKHTNFAYSVITVAPTPAISGTTLTVDVGDGQLFPVAPFNATVWPSGTIPTAYNAEIVRVTSIIGDVLTIVRAQESSTPIVIQTGYQIAASITAKTLQDVENAINAGGMTALRLVAGTVTNDSTAFTFSNSNNVSFGLSNGVITASASSPAQTAFTFVNSNGVSFGTNGGSVTATVQTNYLTTAMRSDAVTLSNINVSAGTTSNNLSALTFSNSNGVSFGLNGSVITASVSPSGGGSISVSAGIKSANVAGITFNNSNNVTFGYDGTNITASVPNVTNSSLILSDANTSLTIARLAFSNSNGLTLSLSTTTGGSATLVGSYTVPNVTNSSFTLSDNATSLTIARLAVTNLNGVTLSLSTTTGGSATVVGSVATSLTNINISAGTTSTNASAFTFSNGNNVTFGINGGVITASVVPPSGAAINISAGTTSTNAGAFTFANGGGVSFGLGTGANAGQITATVNTSLTNINVSAGTTSNNLSAITFANSNGLTFGLNASTITASYTVPNVTNSSLTLSDNATSLSIARLALTNLNGITMSLSTTTGGSATIVASYTVPNVPAATSWTVSDANTSATVGRLAFTNSNGLTLSLSTSNNGNHTVIGSYTVPTITSWTVSDANTSATVGRLAFTGSNGITLSLSTSNNGNHTVIGSYTVPSTAGLLSAINMSAGTTSTNASAFTFSNGNGVSFGIGTGANAGVVTASVQTNYLTTAALSSQTLAFTLSGNSSTTNSSQILNGGYALAGGNNVTLQQSNNTVSISVGNYITTAALSSQTLAFSLSGNSATTNSSQILNGGYALAGGNNVTLQQSNNTVSISVGNYITTAALSSQTLAFSLSGNSATTNSSQILNGGYALAGGNNVTLQQSNNTISISVGNYITTAALSSQTLGFSLGGNSGTTNSSRISNGGFVLAGGNNVTILQSNNTISISAFNQSTQSAIEGVGVSNAGNTAGNVGLLTGSDYVLAGSGSITLSQSTAAGVATCWIQHPAWITTAALSSQTLAFSLGGNSATTNSSQILNGGYVLAGGANVTIQQSNNTISISAAAAAPSPVNISAGTTSNNLGSIIFANANGVSFGLGTGASSQSVTASIATSLTNVNVSAGTTSSNISAFTFSNGSGVSFGLGTGANAGVVTASVATSLTNINISAGTTSTNASAFTFSNANGVTFGLGTGANAGVITASAAGGGGVAVSNSQTLFTSGTVAFSEGGGAITIASSAGGQSLMFSVPQTSSLTATNGLSISTNGSTISVVAPMGSFWANQDRMVDDNSTAVNTGVSVLQVLPFMMPYAISGAFMRIPMSVSMVSSESAATTANSTVTFNRLYSQAIAIYDNNAGASSLSLSTIFTTNAAWTIQHVVGMGAQGSRYTVTQNITYPISGTTSQFTTSSAQSSANVGFSTNLLTAFTGPRFLDIPFATTLGPGNYWLAVGVSTNSATTGGLPTGLSGASMAFSLVGMSHSNLSWCVPGIAANSSVHLLPGLGSWSTNSAVMTTGSLQLASISTASSNPLMYFQIQRWA